MQTTCGILESDGILDATSKIMHTVSDIYFRNHTSRMHTSVGAGVWTNDSKLRLVFSLHFPNVPNG